MHDSMTLRQRAEHIWYYYKIHIIVSAFLLCVVVSLVVHYTSRKELAFSAVLFDTVGQDENESLKNRFSAFAGIDLKKSDVLFETSLHLDSDNEYTSVTAAQYLQMRVAAGDLDAVVMREKDFTLFADSAFLDLRECLTAEELYALDGSLYFIDMQDAESSNPFDPEAMTEPVPVGISTVDCENLLEAFYYPKAKYVLGISITSENRDISRSFIQYICSIR